PADAAPEAATIEEAELPIVDVEDQWPPPLSSREQADAEARRPRLRGQQHITVGEARQRRQHGSERGPSRAGYRPVAHAAIARRPPDVVGEARAHDIDLVPRGQQAREQIGATGGVVREVEGEDRDLHATRRAYRASRASASRAPE